MSATANDALHIHKPLFPATCIHETLATINFYLFRLHLTKADEQLRFSDALF